jgi:lipoyl(octanoyl) transferase
VRDGARSGRENMARDAELFTAAEAGQAGGRLYSWMGPCVSLGRFQTPQWDLIKPDLVPWVMRPTGGKGVLHGHDITICLAMPLAEGEYRNIKRAYRRIIGPIIDALQACGLPACLGEDSRFLAKEHLSADCFATAAGNDVVHRDTGQKVCGCALRFTRRAVLLQASIPISEPLVSPSLVFREPHVYQPMRWEHQNFFDALSSELRTERCHIVAASAVQSGKE